MSDADLIQRLPLMPREHLERVLEWAVRQRETSINTAPLHLEEHLNSSWVRGWDAFGEALMALLSGRKDVIDHLPHKETTT